MSKSRKQAGRASQKAQQKVLGVQLAELGSEERILLQELKAKKIRKLVDRVSERTEEFADWKLKSKCCRKALHKMCKGCPRRVLVQLAARGEHVLPRR